jgi:RHS repeat-associated protein
VSGPDGNWTFHYDLRGNLREAVRPDGKHLQYLVDGLGRRVGRAIDGAVAEGFLYRNRLQVAAWLDSGGNVKAQFVYASRAGVPDAMLMNGRTYRIVADASGSPRLVVDAASGEVAEQIDYDEFGRVLRDTAPGFQPFGFAGGLRDPDTGSLHFGNRDYDPASGRWTTPDLLGFAAGMNLYEYVHGDPLDFIDPSSGQSVAPLTPLPPTAPPPVGLVPPPVPETPGLLGAALDLIVGAIETMGSTVVLPLAILLTPNEIGPEPWPDKPSPLDEWECGPTPMWMQCASYEELGWPYASLEEAMSEFTNQCRPEKQPSKHEGGYCPQFPGHYDVNNVRTGAPVGSVSCCPLLQRPGA